MQFSVFNETGKEIFTFQVVLYFFVSLCSYDTWVSTSDVDGDVEDPPSSEKPWRVRRLR